MDTRSRISCQAMRAFLPLFLALLPLPALAETEACLTSINGAELAVMYDTRDASLRENRTTRERLFGTYGKITCPGFVTLREMTPGLTDAERTPFCLTYDKGRKTYTGFDLGDRDAWLGCKAPSGRFCRSVTATKEAAGQVAGAIGRAATGQGSGEGRSFVHSASGALIASGAGSYVTTTLGTVANSVATALAAPGVATAAAVSVVAVGGAVFVCGK